MATIKIIPYITKYKGCIIRNEGTHFTALGRSYTTYAGAQLGIDAAFRLLKHSIDRTPGNVVRELVENTPNDADLGEALRNAIV